MIVYSFLYIFYLKCIDNIPVYRIFEVIYLFFTIYFYYFLNNIGIRFNIFIFTDYIYWSSKKLSPLHEALQAIQSGILTFRDAQMLYNIPRSEVLCTENFIL